MNKYSSKMAESIMEFFSFPPNCKFMEFVTPKPQFNSVYKNLEDIRSSRVLMSSFSIDLKVSVNFEKSQWSLISL